MPEFTAEELKAKTDEELAVMGERNHPLSAEGILISNERNRRLISGASTKRGKWCKALRDIAIGVAVSVIGTSLIWLLSRLWTQR